MWANMFQPQANNSNRSNFIFTILRIVKDALIIADSIFHIAILRLIIDCLNEVINEENDLSDYKY